MPAGRGLRPGLLHPRGRLRPLPAFSIAGWTVAFEGGDEALATRLEADWRGFVVAGGRAATWLELRIGAPVQRPRDWRPVLPAIRGGPGLPLHLEGDGFRAEISANRRSGFVAQPPERFPLEAVARVLLAESLLERGGVLLHGVALAHQGRAAVFTGFSGAGKSTLGAWGARGGLTLLADELVALLPEGPGFAAHGTPWNQGTAGSAALAQLGLLAHGRQARLRAVEASTVLRVMLSNVLEPADQPEVRARLFQVAGRVLAAVPARELEFAPDLAAAEAVRGALEAR